MYLSFLKVLAWFSKLASYDTHGMGMSRDNCILHLWHGIYLRYVVISQKKYLIIIIFGYLLENEKNIQDCGRIILYLNKRM